MICSIRFGNTGSTTRVGNTEISERRCAADNLGGTLTYHQEFDIVITDNPNIDFFIDPTLDLPQPTGELDLYSVILHELGHAHLLMHVNDEEDLMYFEAYRDLQNDIEPWNRKVQLSTSNISGGTQIVNEGIQTDFSFCSIQESHVHEELSLTTNCDFGLSSQFWEAKRNGKRLKVFPNPSNGRVSIEVPSEVNGEIQIQLIDPMGRLLLSDELNGMGYSKDLIEVEFGQRKTGLYELVLISGDEIYRARLIVH
jgi:hypothetical protein